MKASRPNRSSNRKQLGALHFSNLISVEPVAVLARSGNIVDASTTGFKLRVSRRDLVPKNLRGNLSIDCLVGEKILLSINEMNLELSGTVKRTKMIGRGIFEIGIDFSADAPDYWRECLLELLPTPDEMPDIPDDEWQDH
jgi:hypothetical protein